jgi:hypothetical protein
MRQITTAVLVALLGLLLACGGGGSIRPTAPTGTLTLLLGSDSLPGYSQVMVGVEKVEATADGSSWTLLGSPKKTVNLVTLQNGNGASLLAATVNSTTFTQFRITWATVNYQSAISVAAYTIATGGAQQILTMPTTSTLSGPITVGPNGAVVAQIMLSGQQAVQTRAGLGATFLAQGAAYDLAASARITGRLLDGTSPLVGAEVFGETLDALGVATLQRRAITDATGRYVLEGLPLNTNYVVVAQPVGASYSYPAGGTSVVVSSAALYTADLAFSSPVAAGSLTLTLTPASTLSQGSWGELRQPVAIGTIVPPTLIVRSQTAVTLAANDQVVFQGLTPGFYGVTAQRSLAGAAPVMKLGTQVLVNVGAPATSQLAFP